MLARDTSTGALSEIQCLAEGSSPPAGCTTARDVGGSQTVVLSPDGLHAYSGDDTQRGISVFDRDPTTGLLTQKGGAAGCISDTGDDDAGNPTCTAGRGLTFTYGLTVSPDGQGLYVAEDSSTEGIAVFSLDPATGAATQLPGLAGCIDADGASNGTSGLCTKAPAVANDWIPAVSPDGSSVYLASYGDQAVTTFARETGPTCSAISASTAYQTPVTITLSCVDPDGDPLSTSIVGGPAHGTLGTAGPTVTYTPAQGYSGTDSFTFDASDGTNTSAAATATITVAAPPVIPPSTTPPPALKLTNVTQSHRTWRESNALATIASGPKPPIGTTFSFTLNKTARVTFAFTQKKNAHAKSITRGTITFTGHAGRNKVAFGGRVNRDNRLARGTYTVIITAGKAPARRLTFTIVT